MLTLGTPLRIALVEDEGLFRELLRTSLDAVPNFEVVGSFGDPAGALDAIPALAPDVVVLDIDLGKGSSGIELGKALRDALPELGVLLLSHHVESSYLDVLTSPEGRGWSYLIKKSVADLDALARAIHGAAHGVIVLDPAIVQAMGAQLQPKLSPRERQVLELIAQGHSNSAIADKLHLSEKTIENHVSSLYRRLEIDTCDQRIHPRVRAAALCLESRLHQQSPHRPRP
jgi:DNA-binding NarL/FixJ family response regulator